ncbi:hypothetical protein ADIARSV_2681 [Arcticibacter svalbardensis MN12-7]|uniref:DNA mimic protein DMP19 C-terminal domain-containing protein n=1 Tax=Arcticibacter svalbardensis MN12-7 TaxID=1150600 RepID=R9GQR7_9SPHI|nr:DUF4375 domain-containing protein [Arcticibacter svalbardensis]EOR94147.1 hypothetical protein ADIARSV_2681 [Arcticibacter svalbardensis MN12-7]
MGFITTVLNFFGCAAQTMKDGEKVSNETKEQLMRSIESFKNRPIYKELTEQIIDTTSDDKLLQLIFDNLSEIQSTDPAKEYETVMGWNKSRQAIYMIWGLEGQVNNGGYNQFYFNSTGQFYKHLPNALKLVGANKFADLTKRANGIFEKENSKITQHQDGTMEGFSKSYDDNPLNKFDDEFYVLYKNEDLQKIQVNFIRKHKIEFIDK